MYNSIAWSLQEKNEELQMAEQFSSFATAYARSQMKNPTAKRPDHMTGKQWAKYPEITYAQYADTYAMVLYKLGQYEKGLALSREAALDIHKGKNAGQNNTYTLLAEKVLPAKELKPQLENFVREGQSTAAVKAALKTIYVAEHSSEENFEPYIAALEHEMYLKMVEELKKSMLSDPSPSFALYDLDGKKVNMADLKGKVVILDFWATWCGPCIASFPGMQKMVTKYNDNPNVKFLFVNTWENKEDKEKNARDFITANRYTFQVLMDNDDKVIGQFKVDGIPTKFVIGPEGNIRFKSVGFHANEDKMMAELDTMIELAGGE